ncbi:MAG TPA: hypothetical protein VK066_14065 [Chloroflexota bacterium]|nr:hypothetical protein [Chloroflexota bacterium]
MERHQRDSGEGVLLRLASGHFYRGRQTGGTHVQDEQRGRNQSERKSEQ